MSRVIIILFPGHDVSAPFLERSSPASKDSRALLGEIEEEVLDVGALVQHVDQRLPVHHQRAPTAGYMYRSTVTTIPNINLEGGMEE